MNPLRHALLPLAALLLLAPLAPGAAPSSMTALPNGTFVSDDGVVSAAQVAWSGDCNGQGFLTVTLYRPTGTQTWSFLYESTMPLDVCDAVTRCYECPPVPVPFVWTLDNWEGASHFAGGGLAYYDAYQYWTLAWSMQGSFLDGTLEFRGVLTR